MGGCAEQGEVDERTRPPPLSAERPPEEVRNLQVRLAGVGQLSLVGIRLGSFCDRTREALAAFQRQRGLPATGEWDDTTWEALVDSAWAFGARLLYLSSPPLRGDDVEALQVRLARLGFHCGKADGVFGPLTVRGLTEFQHNTGLVADGICGPVTVRALERIGGQTGSGPGVVAVREDERRRSAAEVDGAIRVAIGLRGAPRVSALETSRALRRLGHRVLVVDSDDDATQAVAANSFDAHAFVGLGVADDVERVSYYRTVTHESAGGHRLATAIADRIGDASTQVVGERQRILRETAMVAVVCAFSEHTWATRCGDLATAVHEWGRIGR